MSTNLVPEKVELRDERIRMPIQHRCSGPEYERYSYIFDAELESMIAAAEGDAIRAFALWFESACKTMGKSGAKLIPGPIQILVGLPVRQIYVDLFNAAATAYLIESDGRVTTKLLRVLLQK